MKDFKKYLIIIISIMSLCIIILSSLYVGNFNGGGLSKNQSDWGTFGDYFGGILNPVIGIVNIIVLIIISYQIAGWDNKRHRNEFLYKAYCDLTEKLDSYKISSLKSIELKFLEEYLLGFKINQQFLFEGKASITFTERVFRLESTTLQLRKLLEKEEELNSKSGSVDVSDLVIELMPFIIANAKETEITIMYKEFEKQRQYLIGFFQRVLNNSNYDGYSESDIIANDGKDRTIAIVKRRNTKENES
jgi:uncharacterized membrane protein